MKKSLSLLFLGEFLSLFFISLSVYGSEEKYCYERIHTLENAPRPTVRILPCPFYESDSERWIDHRNQMATAEIRLANTEELKYEFESNYISSFESGNINHASLSYSDNYGRGAIFTQAHQDDISDAMLQEGKEILTHLERYVSPSRQWGVRGHNTLFVKIYFLDVTGECLPSLDCGLYVSGYENFYNTTDGKVKTVRDVIRDEKDDKKTSQSKKVKPDSDRLESFKNKTHSLEHLTARIHTLDALELGDKKFFPTSLTMRLDDIDETLVFNREYDYPKTGLKQMKWFLENVLKLEFPKFKGSGEEVFALSSKAKDRPSRESEMLLTLLKYKNKLNPIFRYLFNSEAVGDFSDNNFLVHSDIIKSSSRFMDSEQVFVRSLESGDEQVKLSAHISYGSNIRKPTKAVVHVLSYNDMCRYCRGTISWLLASGGLRDAIRNSLFIKMRDEGIDEAIVRTFLPEDDIDIRFCCSSLKNPEACC